MNNVWKSKEWLISLHSPHSADEYWEKLRREVGPNMLSHDYCLIAHTWQGTKDWSTYTNRNWNKLACIRQPGIFLGGELIFRQKLYQPALQSYSRSKAKLYSANGLKFSFGSLNSNILSHHQCTQWNKFPMALKGVEQTRFFIIRKSYGEGKKIQLMR